MALVTTIEEVQAVIQNSNLDLDESIPDMGTTQENRLFSYLGEDFSNLLQAAYNDIDNAAAELKTAITLVQKALVPFAYADNLGTIHARITSAGVKYMTSADMPPVARWAFEEVKSVLLTQAYTALESMLAFLERNRDDYPEWEAGEGFKKRKSLLIKSGTDFNEYFTLHQPCRTYHLLMSCMRDVDSLQIIPMLGKEFYTSLKEMDTPEDEEIELVTRLKAAIANLAIAQACDKLPVRIYEQGFTVLNAFGDGANNNRANAPDTSMSALRSKCLADGKRYLDSARKYVNANASSTVFADFFESEWYRNPATSTVSRGNDKRKIFRF